jgi:tripeptide aminopeptidase
VLQTALEILCHGHSHPPLTFLWTVQEETGLHGARLAALSLLGKPQLAFNWDGGGPDKLTIGATGGYRTQIQIYGRASHAGGAPERGISAIAVAGLAIADLQSNGWHGDIRKPAGHGTSNIGFIQGGEATNVVTDHVTVRAEARSHNPRFRQRIVREIERAFRKAARNVKDVDGRSGSVVIDGRLDYESFRLKPDESCIVAAEHAISSVGLTPLHVITNGGIDANWMAARGIPTVTLGCGQQGQHTVDESLDVHAFETACRIALRLATATEV